MLNKEDISSIYAQWEEEHLPTLVFQLGLKNEHQKKALFRVFDSLLWGAREKGSLLPRIERANVTLEAAAIPQVERALSAVVGFAAASLSEHLGEHRVPAALLAGASVSHGIHA